MKFKKILAFSTSLLICCGLINTPQVADFISNSMVANAVEDDSGSCGENCTYSFDSSTGTLTISGTGDMYSYYSKPETVPWNDYKTDIKTIIIEDGVTSIGSSAFIDCILLTNITISDSVTSIYSWAFCDCTLLTNLIIPDSVTYIGSAAFIRCEILETIQFSKNLTYVGSDAFGGTAFIRDCKDDFVMLNDNFLYLYQGSSVNVIIPDNVSYIAEDAFEYSLVEDVTLPNGITAIDREAFYGCKNLKNITIPNSVTIIKSYAFRDCTSLTSITIPDSVTTIEYSAFLNCESLTSINIPSSVTSIACGTGWDPFANCYSLKSITVDEDNKYYSDLNGVLFNKNKTNLIRYPIAKDDETSYKIPKNVTSIAESAFRDCSKITNLELSENIKKIYSCTFDGCKSLKKVTIPNSVTSISQWAFGNCTSLTEITIPDIVTSIGYNAFYNCEKLTEITIPNSVTSIGHDAFNYCTNLTDIYFKGTEDEWSTIKIESGNEPLTNATIHYNYTDEEPPITTTTTEPVTTTSETTTTPPPSEPVEPIIEDKTLIFGTDTWNFTNTSRYFGKGSHYISNEFYKDLLSKLSNTEKQRVEKSKNSNWNGSCYGLATLPILYKEDIFNVSEWQTGAEYLHDINAPNDDDTESLINYYYLLQCTDEIQQEISQSLYDETEQEKLQRLIEMASNVKEGGTPVLLCYYGKFYKISFGGHAVTAYGVEYGSWIKNDTAYNGRILLYDNNCEGFEDNYCLYFNTTSNNWYIPEYEISSTNGGKLGLVTNDINLINNNGYFDDDSNDVMPNIDYISIMQSVAMNTDFSVQKIQKSDDDWTINGATGEDEIKIFYDFMSDDETQKPNVKIALRDATSGYQFKVDNGTDLIDLDMSYEDSLLSASADNGTSAKFSPDGYVEINSEDSDFSLGMVFNDGYYNLPWYDVNVTGHHSNVASMTKTDDGIILFSDNLVNITVQANNDDISTGVNFSTTENTVLIYEIDENTIGISIDENDDRIFETKIAESPSKGDLNNDNTIDKLDLLLMKKSILNMYSYDAVADLNNDGYINILDLIALKQELFK